MSIFDTTLGFIAPHVCIGCDYEGSLLCQTCATFLSPSPLLCIYCERVEAVRGVCERCSAHTALEDVRSAVRYEGLARQLIHSLKYERAQAAASIMAARMAAVCSYGTTEGWFVTHAPTTAARARSRGYDQARLLAKAIAKRLSCPSLVVLRRISQFHQVGATGRQRRRQMEHAFLVYRPSVVKNAKILLVDDVITTGATMEAAARALRQAGAARVEALTFARA